MLALDCVIRSDKNKGTQPVENLVISGRGRFVDKSIGHFNTINNAGSHHVVVIMFYIDNTM